MLRIKIFSLALFLSSLSHAQNILPPDKTYGKLFADVQLSKTFRDNKTFVDCIPKRDPQKIVEDYLKIISNPNVRFSLRIFVEKNFILPDTSSSTYKTAETNIEEHINHLWTVLERNAKPDSCLQTFNYCKGTLLALPYSYVVPGGRFREIYYWDSYFTMLGLKESGKNDLLENMVKNFAYLIHKYGHVPNGNRNYYLSRSQPPFFSLMVDLLAEIKGEQVYQTYLEALEEEYNYWMDKTSATHHVKKMPDGSILNCYYDQSSFPRQESYAEDIATAQKNYPESRPFLYQNLRSAAESGWDFSSRWFGDGKNINSIRTTSIIPVDLNCLLYHLEKTLATTYQKSNDAEKAMTYQQLSEKRKRAIIKYCWSLKNGWFVDYDHALSKQSSSLTLAGMYPYFFGIADNAKMIFSKNVLQKKFMKAGGVVTTTSQTGQQWDAPNGWAPLQWITILGLENYKQHKLANDIAQRWIRLNKKVFVATGKLMEKYDVMHTDKFAGGGEYPSQDGFGWTNGVLLALMHRYKLN